MARVTNPLVVPQGAEIRVDGQSVTVKGSKGQMSHDVHQDVSVAFEDGQLRFAPRNEKQGSIAQTGTAKALVGNLIRGVTEGFEKKLELVGVGYRAQAQGKVLNLTLGFSHPINYPVPEGISIETPSQTEVLVKGTDKQKVGQVAAEIRGFRPPEPYKGKGVKYADERIIRKEAKKK